MAARHRPQLHHPEARLWERHPAAMSSRFQTLTRPETRATIYSLSIHCLTEEMSEHAEKQILGLLAAHPEGLSAPALRKALRPRISQPTLSRRLMALRARGEIAKVGSARATRYFLAGGRHRLAELRSQALHQRVAEKLVRNPDVARKALETLKKLRERNPSGHPYHDQWEELLRGDRLRLLQTLVADTETARALRQETPFAGTLSANERTEILMRFKGT